MSELYGRLNRSKLIQADPPLSGLTAPRGSKSEMRVALLTAAGVHLQNQKPFDMLNPQGDSSYRVIPGEVDLADLVITHDYYDHSAADQDVNCVFPIERLRELVAAGELGEVAPRHVGFMGHIFGAERRKFVGQSINEIARIFKTDNVALVVASPG